MITITEDEEKRNQYQLTGFKNGVSLRLLVDVEKTLSHKQREELKNNWGLTTIEEVLDFYYQSLSEKKTPQFNTISSSELETMAKSSEKYFTKDELAGFMNGGPGYPTGALKP